MAATPSSLETEEKQSRQNQIERGILNVFVNGLRDESGKQFISMFSHNNVADALKFAESYEYNNKQKKTKVFAISEAKSSEATKPKTENTEMKTAIKKL